MAKATWRSRTGCHREAERLVAEDRQYRIELIEEMEAVAEKFLENYLRSKSTFWEAAYNTKANTVAVMRDELRRIHGG